MANILNSADKLVLLPKHEIQVGKQAYLIGSDKRYYLLTIVLDEMYYDEDNQLSLTESFYYQKKKELFMLKHPDEKKKKEMTNLFLNILNIRANDIKTNEEIIDIMFESGEIIKKGIFTKEEFLIFAQNETA